MQMAQAAEPEAHPQLCRCGCGQEVKYKGASTVRGHHSRLALKLNPVGRAFVQRCHELNITTVEEGGSCASGLSKRTVEYLIHRPADRSSFLHAPTVLRLTGFLEKPVADTLTLLGYVFPNPLAEWCLLGRMGLGLSQQALARSAGISTDRIVDAENGHGSSPNRLTLRRIADVLGPVPRDAWDFTQSRRQKSYASKAELAKRRHDRLKDRVRKWSRRALRKKLQELGTDFATPDALRGLPYDGPVGPAGVTIYMRALFTKLRKGSARGGRDSIIRGCPPRQSIAQMIRRLQEDQVVVFQCQGCRDVVLAAKSKPLPSDQLCPGCHGGYASEQEAWVADGSLGDPPRLPHVRGPVVQPAVLRERLIKFLEWTLGRCRGLTADDYTPLRRTRALLEQSGFSRSHELARSCRSIKPAQL